MYLKVSFTFSFDKFRPTNDRISDPIEDIAMPGHIDGDIAGRGESARRTAKILQNISFTLNLRY